MRATLSFLAALCCWPLLCSSQPAASDGWISLFNSKDLADWTIKIAKHPVQENFNQTFRVEDGILKVDYSRYAAFDGEFGHIFYKTPFSHYKLRIEYRFTGQQTPGGPSWANRNSGVMVHAQSAESMSVSQPFPVSLEVQMLGGLGDGPRPTGNLCTPGTYVEMDGKAVMQHCVDSQSPTFDGDQWVTLEVEVYGDSLLRHVVNGQSVIAYRHPKIGESPENLSSFLEPSWLDKVGTPLGAGYICLQAESSPVEFRKVELLNLKGCTNPACPKYSPQHLFTEKCTCSMKKERTWEEEVDWRLRNDWAWMGRFRRENNQIPPPAKNEKRVVFMGNSITEGWSAADPDFFKDKPYINRGISGQTTPQMLVRFRADVIQLQPTAVVILAGTNDIAGNTGETSIETIFGHIASMAELAQAHGIKVVLCAVLPVYDYPWKPGLKPADKIVLLNDLLKKYAKENDCAFVDFHKAMRDRRNGLRPELGGDGVHPNLDGYRIMGPLVEKALKKWE